MNATVKDVMSTHVIAVREIATVEGTPESEAAGRGILDATRHVEGVVAVRDRCS